MERLRMFRVKGELLRTLLFEMNVVWFCGRGDDHGLFDLNEYFMAWMRKFRVNGGRPQALLAEVNPS